MQFYLNGYKAGDPRVLPAAPGAMGAQESLAGEVDVLIVGCGPAGLVLAAQLAAFPGIKTRIVERKAGPLELGQADGIACRTVEMGIHNDRFTSRLPCYCLARHYRFCARCAARACQQPDACFGQLEWRSLARTRSPHEQASAVQPPGAIPAACRRPFADMILG